MSRTLLLKLNNYNYTDEYIDMIMDFKRTGNLPDHLSNYQQNHIKKQYKEFIVNGEGKLIYNPRVLNLEVVRRKDIPDILKDLYDDPQVGTGASVKGFYNKVTARYLGIKRNDVEEFLGRQVPYQLTKKEPRNMKRPLVALYPNHRWACDLIDMNLYEGYNNHKKFILTVIDFFTKKVFAQPVTNKTAENVKNALAEICRVSRTYPLILQSDNGGEFKGVFKTFCADNDITQVKTLSYSPTSNGLVENFNMFLRKMIREGFIREKSLNWVDHLQDYVINRNSSKHSVTKYTPDDIWIAGRRVIQNEPRTEEEKERLDNRVVVNKSDRIQKVQNKFQKKREKDFRKFEHLRFNVGDRVRVLYTSLYSKLRKLQKEGNEKLIPVRYTPDIYTIRTVLKPSGERKDFMNPRYWLNDPDGNPVITELKLNNPNAIRGNQIFFGSELQLMARADEDDPDVDDLISRAEANKLNGVEDERDREQRKTKAKERRQIRKSQPPSEIQKELDSRVAETSAGIVERVKTGRERKKNQFIFNKDHV